MWPGIAKNETMGRHGITSEETREAPQPPSPRPDPTTARNRADAPARSSPRFRDASDVRSRRLDRRPTESGPVVPRLILEDDDVHRLFEGQVSHANVKIVADFCTRNRGALEAAAAFKRAFEAFGALVPATPARRPRTKARR
jgi:hypothetical protein